MQELQRNREALDDAEKALRELRIEADLAGVPAEWRVVSAAPSPEPAPAAGDAPPEPSTEAASIIDITPFPRMRTPLPRRAPLFPIDIVDPPPASELCREDSPRTDRSP